VKEVTAWVEAVLELWDQPTKYESASAAARTASAIWHPNSVVPMWEQFLSLLVARQ
jgi:hypothetical protein